MRRIRRKRKSEPTIALINIVFLMLIFFLVAGTLAQPLDSALELVNTEDLESRPPPDALVVHKDGTLTYRGNAVADAADYAATLDEESLTRVLVVPDRDLGADRLVEVSRTLRRAGASSVIIVTERALQ